MQRRRVSSGLNWKPHLMFFAESDMDVDDGGCADASRYAISVGTLSDVIPEIACVSIQKENEVWGWRTVPTRPCLDNIDIVRSRAVNSSHAYIPFQSA
jgi:hypothetical protein